MDDSLESDRRLPLRKACCSGVRVPEDAEVESPLCTRFGSGFCSFWLWVLEDELVDRVVTGRFGLDLGLGVGETELFDRELGKRLDSTLRSGVLDDELVDRVATGRFESFGVDVRDEDDFELSVVRVGSVLT